MAHLATAAAAAKAFSRDRASRIASEKAAAGNVPVEREDQLSAQENLHDVHKFLLPIIR